MSDMLFILPQNVEYRIVKGSQMVVEDTSPLLFSLRPKLKSFVHKASQQVPKHFSFKMH